MSPREDTLETLPPPGEDGPSVAARRRSADDVSGRAGDAPGLAVGDAMSRAVGGAMSRAVGSERESDRYEDLGLIGEGGFGEVRRVLDRKLGRTVAMKILHAGLAASPALRGRLANEARLAARLQHPGIVGVYDFGERSDGRIWITMPEVHGRTLAAVLDSSHEGAAARAGSFAWSRRRLLDAFARVCQAVAFAHRQGVIHRDLKPDNIMLGDLGEVLVMDWGLARATEREAAIALADEVIADTIDEDVAIAFAGAGAIDAPVRELARAGAIEAPVRELARAGAIEAPVRELARAGAIDAPVRDLARARAIHAPFHDTPGPGRATSREPSRAYFTRDGDVLGTPAYMAPEQARGEVHRHGPALDVYALGAILYHLLAGRPPYTGSAHAVIARVIAGPPQPLATLVRAPADSLADLFAACEKAMAREPGDRFMGATDLASEVLGWLDGVQRRERALEALERAGAVGPEVARLRDRAEALRTEARIVLSQVKPYAPAEAKAPAWDRFDEAQRIAHAVALRETEWLEAVHGALAIDPALDEAHHALANHYRDALERAEATGRDEDAVRFEAQLRTHDRGRHAAFLSGLGTLSIRTDPPGAIAVLHRFVERRRRLVAEPVETLGPTPIRERSLPRGSYLVELSAPDRATVRYPVWIGRGEHWDGRPPDVSAPFAIPLPRADEIDADEVYVPAGWTSIGGDPEAPDSLPRRRVWIDGFVLGRYPVTNARYIAFLDDLARRGLEAEALAACPRSNRGTVPGADDRLAYDRAPDGRFLLREDDPGEAWDPNGPAVLMSWQGAVAYVRWLAARTGRPYRLPHELEREKAARGADARRYPWGNTFDPSWTCMLESQAGDPARASVLAFPTDESPYGARGMAGNTRDFCSNPWRLEGPSIEGDRLWIGRDLAGEGEHLVVRGGAWSSVAHLCGCAGRFGSRPDHRRSTLGFRVARSFP